MDRRAWTLLVALAGIWGASYMFIKIGIRDLEPAAVAWLRTAFAAAVLVPVALVRGDLRAGWIGLGPVAFLAAVQVGGPFLLIAEGEEHISSALAGILVASTPLFTALLAIRLDHEERAEGLRLVGILCGLAGVAVLLGLDLGDSSEALIGGLLVVLASLGYAVGSFVAKPRLATAPPSAVAAWVMLASVVLLGPAAAATAPADAPGAGPLAAVAALGVLGTGVAFVIFYDLMGTVGPARTFIVTYLAPAFAVLYGALLLGEAITAATVAGLVLIVGGSWIAAEGRLPGRARRAGARAQPPLEPIAPASDSAGR